MELLIIVSIFASWRARYKIGTLSWRFTEVFVHENEGGEDYHPNIAQHLISFGNRM